MIKSIRQLHAKLIGSNACTTLQARIFHEVSVIAMVGLPLALLVNIFINVPLVNLVLSAAWIVIVALYINSRYFGRLWLSFILFSAGTSILMIFNYFINSGIHGPTLILFLLSLVFILLIMPTRQYIFWILINVSIVGGLLLIEYYNSGFIKVSYAKRSDLFLDIATTYLSVVVCIGAVLSYLINSYQREKDNAEKASLALKEANDSKTRLLSILSHDLRSPLNSISSFLEILHSYGLSPEERHFLERSLLNETKNTQVMLHNLLNWTKSQMDGGTSVNMVRLNLSEVVSACLLVQQGSADIKTVGISVNIDPSIELDADLDMLKLVIRNLINNAIKFTSPGGEIQISSSCVSGHVKLHIMDNGVGIPTERQQELFKLNAASTYGTSNEKGVGLGLILCKEYTEMQNGRISFSSVPGNGTTFTLEFLDANGDLPTDVLAKLNTDLAKSY
ncbi:two-component sensor histidine kinase [Pedobacter sp. HMWF019]|uniref:sensor histidine kinase n=1 Tax=Pedobacter sp. HMWF019 TaxID=2056856 RepID=UPI000D3B4E14|nr:HAMP domain-containing sensor histidine kinase [Pedobacter sp. HMWF019]PTS97138.1 two-component sensor histidine kinase [Pedobacter sp. HMWF019]